jgi:hypothetical protein
MNILLKYSKTETLEHNKGEENEDWRY